MIPRPFWLSRIEGCWQEAPIAWLAGVRRVGKSTLALSLGSERARYVNCDLPIVEDLVKDPELFFRNSERPVIIFDEIHQLKDPARLLKIGADVFPHLKILATGSSTLAASRKFRDTLAGRKRSIHLTPITWDEFSAFSKATLLRRLYHGGLPEPLLSEAKKPGFYREWMDSFFSRDIQRLFAFRDPDKFNALFEFVMKQSGGLLETARTARALGISRPTVESHLRAMEATHAVTLLRPFFGGGQREITKMPKIYAFDTGFVSFSRGWDPLRPADYGLLWEHVVLEYLQAHAHAWRIQYWRDTAGREVDFVIAQNRDEVDAIECKWDPAEFDAAALRAFRNYYPKGKNYLLSPLSVAGYPKLAGDLEVFVTHPEGWKEAQKNGREPG
jgi:hypothetical protein